MSRKERGGASAGRLPTVDACSVPATLRSITQLHPQQSRRGSFTTASSTGGGACVVSHRSRGPLLLSGAPQDRRTEVGVSE